jgi:hypothetical protein
MYVSFIASMACVLGNVSDTAIAFAWTPSTAVGGAAAQASRQFIASPTAVEGVAQLVPGSTMPLACTADTGLVGIVASVFASIGSASTNGSAIPMAGADSAYHPSMHPHRPARAAKLATSAPVMLTEERTARQSGADTPSPNGGSSVDVQAHVMRINNMYVLLDGPACASQAELANGGSEYGTHAPHKRPLPTVVAASPTQANTSLIANHSFTLHAMVCGVADGVVVPVLMLPPQSNAEIRGQKHIQLLFFAGRAPFVVMPGALSAACVASNDVLGTVGASGPSGAAGSSDESGAKPATALPAALATIGDTTYWLTRSSIAHGPSSFMVVSAPATSGSAGAAAAVAAQQDGRSMSQRPSSAATIVVPIIHAGVQPRAVMTLTVACVVVAVIAALFIALFLWCRYDPRAPRAKASAS